MDNKSNSYIEKPNPFDEYNKNLEEFAMNNPEIIEISRLCYEVFKGTNDGKKLMNELENRFLFGSLVNPLSQNSSECALYWTGFTDCIKWLRNYANEHDERIKSWTKQ